MATWLNLHVFTGLVGTVLIMFHSAFQFRTPIALATAGSLGVVVLTGIVGSLPLRPHAYANPSARRSRKRSWHARRARARLQRCRRSAPCTGDRSRGDTRRCPRSSLLDEARRRAPAGCREARCARLCASPTCHRGRPACTRVLQPKRAPAAFGRRSARYASTLTREVVACRRVLAAAVLARVPSNAGRDLARPASSPSTSPWRGSTAIAGSSPSERPAPRPS